MEVWRFQCDPSGDDPEITVFLKESTTKDGKKFESAPSQITVKMSQIKKVRDLVDAKYLLSLGGVK